VNFGFKGWSVAWLYGGTGQDLTPMASNIRPQLITHLLDYVASCYLALSVSASKSPILDGQSVDDLFAAYKMGADMIENRVNLESEIGQLTELIPVPVI